MMPISAERQDGFQHRIDGVAPGLEQDGNRRVHSHTDFCQQTVALLGDLLAGVIFARRVLFHRRSPVNQRDVLFFYA